MPPINARTIQTASTLPSSAPAPQPVEPMKPQELVFLQRALDVALTIPYKTQVILQGNIGGKTIVITATSPEVAGSDPNAPPVAAGLFVPQVPPELTQPANSADSQATATDGSAGAPQVIVEGTYGFDNPPVDAPPPPTAITNPDANGPLTVSRSYQAINYEPGTFNPDGTGFSPHIYGAGVIGDRQVIEEVTRLPGQRLEHDLKVNGYGINTTVDHAYFTGAVAKSLGLDPDGHNTETISSDGSMVAPNGEAYKLAISIRKSLDSPDGHIGYLLADQNFGAAEITDTGTVRDELGTIGGMAYSIHSETYAIPTPSTAPPAAAESSVPDALPSVAAPPDAPPPVADPLAYSGGSNADSDISTISPDIQQADGSTADADGSIPQTSPGVQQADSNTANASGSILQTDGNIPQTDGSMPAAAVPVADARATAAAAVGSIPDAQLSAAAPVADSAATDSTTDKGIPSPPPSAADASAADSTAASNTPTLGSPSQSALGDFGDDHAVALDTASWWASNRVAEPVRVFATSNATWAGAKPAGLNGF